jgi:opacity protein-like surface antigen
MKTLALTFVTFCALMSLAYAGPETLSSGKEMKQVVPAPCPEWYGSHEWTVSIWGAYAFPADSDRNDIDAIGANHEDTEGADDMEDNIGRLGHDQFLNEDSAFGGGGDFKYFFSKYFGIGVEGYFLDARNSVGAVLGTLTFRYPIGCSHWAPYIFGGAGAAWGGSHDLVAEDEESDTFFARKVNDSDAVFIGQIGGGLEYRVTRHVGIMADFTWNFTDHTDGDFGMVRSGLTFGF